LDRHLSIVANSFRAAGCLLGIPSLGALLFLVWVWISLRPGPPLTAPATDIGRYGFVGLLNSGAYGAAKAFELFGGVSRWVAGILGMISLAATLAGAGLFYTGRGLSHQAQWARIVGGVLAFAWLLFSIGGIQTFERGGALLSLLFAGAATYTTWVLVWRFS
jgi:hypothetical protein